MPIHPLIVIVLLFSLPLILLTLWDWHSRRTRQPVITPPVSPSPSPSSSYSHDPASLATEAQQQAVLDHLAGLPQFHRLLNGDLIDWHSGAMVSRCPCDDYPAPHLLVTFHRHARVGIVTLGALGRFLAWQNAIASHFGPKSDPVPADIPSAPSAPVPGDQS